MRKMGVLIVYRPNVDLMEEFRKAKEMNLQCCQLCMWHSEMFCEKYAEDVKRAVAETGIEVSAVWAGWAGPCEWNFTAGPVTIGLVPPAYRFARLEELKKASEFAAMINVNQVISHVGFLPNSPADPDYIGTVAALRNLAKLMKTRNQYFLFETGQETPVTLLRTIQDIGTDNLGINLDTANLILYGMANTLDALDVFGSYVMNTHIKDGFYPVDGRKLGKECAVGDGKANIPAVVRKLEELGYAGPFVIEREITGEQQIKDIIRARELVLNS